MKVKIDENLPQSLAFRLRLLNHDADTVKDEDLLGSADPDIWRAAQKEARLFITQDLDFADVRLFAPGTHFGIALVRMDAANRLELTQRVLEVFGNENVESWTGCFAVITRSRVRILRPGPSRS
jgi:predicted nuclease of predicted toxin-antitoxin system